MKVYDDIVIPVIISLLVKWSVSLWGYSGQQKAIMYGDFEAQRHWLEITTNLPIYEWYKQSSNNDLLYWGLDYPPLTAYVSWFFGAIAQVILKPLVELNTSRGYELIEGKIFMRLSVLFCDIMVYTIAITSYNKILNNKNYNHTNRINSNIFNNLLLLIYLLNPALILIDHGHFQYNCVCIGLALLGSLSIGYDYDLLGSFFFTLSLNFKQMSLYYSLVFFCILFRKCLIKLSDSFLSFIYKLLTIGLVVIFTFTVLWLPFCLYHDRDDGCIDGLTNVLVRLFPFNRGIFEDKVANIWYGLSIIYDYRTEWSLDTLKLLSVTLTLLLSLPTIAYNLIYPTNPQKFLISLMNSSLSFFLASFQVHEKSLLLSLIPASLLYTRDPMIMIWYQILGAFSMYPLLFKDQLQVPFYVIISLYLLVIWLYDLLSSKKSNISTSTISRLKLLFVMLSYSGMFTLLVCQQFIKSPDRYPDIYAALFSLYSLINLLVMYIVGQIYLYN